MRQHLAIRQELDRVDLPRGSHGVAFLVDGVINRHLPHHRGTLRVLLRFEGLLRRLGHGNHLFHIRHGRGLLQQLGGIHGLCRVLVLEGGQHQLHEVVLPQLRGILFLGGGLVGFLALVGLL